MAKARKKTMKKGSSKLVAYRVTAKRDGFRRAGIVHAGMREYAEDELSEVQLALIAAEPLLILERLEASQEAVTAQAVTGNDKQEAVSDASFEQGT